MCHGCITNLTLPAQQVWNLYQQRADAEDAIEERKYDFGFDRVNLSSLCGAEAGLHMAMLSDNPTSLFRQSSLGAHVQQALSICDIGSLPWVVTW